MWHLCCVNMTKKAFKLCIFYFRSLVIPSNHCSKFHDILRDLLPFMSQWKFDQMCTKKTCCQCNVTDIVMNLLWHMYLLKLQNLLFANGATIKPCTIIDISFSWSCLGIKIFKHYTHKNGMNNFINMSNHVPYAKSMIC